jgi:hypothetical protein
MGETRRLSALPKIFFGLTIFLAAFLMFLVQPLAGKIITPKYGGAAQVWCVCLLFFQLALLGGYTLSFLMSRLSPRWQSVLYILIFGLSVWFVRIPLGNLWVPRDPSAPIQSLLTMLMAYLSIPCLLLSTVSVMIQNWYRLRGWGEPYHLYSLSNVGSLGALMLYPVVVEPSFTVSTTAAWWTWAYRLLAALACLCAVWMIRRPAVPAGGAEPAAAGQEEDAPGWWDYGWWLFLSATGAVVLLSFTSHLTQDIAPVPLLWVIPLCLYLLTFVLCFSTIRFYSARVYAWPVLVLLLAYLVVKEVKGSHFYTLQIFMIPVLMFFLCMVCHGELYSRRPAARHLPVFYLAIAAGGALGGIFVNLIAPVIFDIYAERYLVLLVLTGLLGYLVVEGEVSWSRNRWLDRVSLVLLLTLCSIFALLPLKKRREVVYQERNFYSVAKIVEKETKDKGPFRILYGGSTVHGSQFAAPEMRKLPTAYFLPDSAVGLAFSLMRAHQPGQPLKVGVIGLGVGTIAVYGQPGDAIRFYEIDPKVKRIADSHFTFLSDSQADITTIMGDGRTSLEREAPQQYDILVIDAFNSDAIPVHLLTREALALDLAHLRQDGLLVIHTSNRHVAVNEVSANGGLALGLKGVLVRTYPDEKKAYQYLSLYTVLSREDWFPRAVEQPEFRKDYPEVEISALKWNPKIGAWTDDHSNLFHAIRTTQKW